MNERIAGDETLLTLKEACQYLRISKTTLYRFMADGRIEGYKIGRLWKFSLGDLRSFVKSRKV